MDPKYDHTQVESKIYEMWEKGRYFTPKIDKSKKPFTIILPLPNANDPMHMGHALFTVEDIMVRYHRMKGDPTLWLPGGDHAGIETQYVFEKHLAKEGKSRFDFDRKTLYEMIQKFVEQNKDVNKNQMKRLGFSLDWSRYHYSLEPEIVNRVMETFVKLNSDGLVYRGERISNYCTKCGTAFSDLEVDYKERDDMLYFLNYGAISIATTRPETIFADVAVAVNPKDKRYKALIGKTATVPLINKSVPIIGDSAVEMDFGTGALKVTPGHDTLDFEIGERHNLEKITILNRAGKLINVPEKYLGLKVQPARETVVKDLEIEGKLIKQEVFRHSVGVCYRCGTIIEPLILPQWFIRTKSLAKPAIEAVKKGTTKIFPKKRFEKLYFDWMENIHDWPVTRQIVWGPRLPIWYEISKSSPVEVVFLTKDGTRKQGPAWQFISEGFFIEEIETGIQRVESMSADYQVAIDKPTDGDYIQDTDTFDTWFLSGQWPVNTLKSKPGDFDYFYPTSVLDTLWDILFFWVARMMMFGLYLTNKVPFETIHLHARVVDEKGQKMSKSKGNVINPIEIVDKYGADALRMALTINVAPASDIVISDDKVRAMRNFSNKLWNIGRFILTTEGGNEGSKEKDNDLKTLINDTLKKTTKDIETYKFGVASERLYQVIWHDFADIYIEDYKKGLISYSALLTSFEALIKLLHPFMPFITEEIWSLMPKKTAIPLIISPWPTSK